MTPEELHGKCPAWCSGDHGYGHESKHRTAGPGAGIGHSYATAYALRTHTSKGDVITVHAANAGEIGDTMPLWLDAADARELARVVRILASLEPDHIRDFAAILDEAAACLDPDGAK